MLCGIGFKRFFIGTKVKQKTVSVQCHWKGDAHFGVVFYEEMYKLDGAQGVS